MSICESTQMHVQTHTFKWVDINKYTETPIKYIPEVFLLRICTDTCKSANTVARLTSSLELCFS